MADASGDPPADDPPPAVPLTQAGCRGSAAQRPQPPSRHRAPAFQAHVRAARSELENQVAHARAEFEEANERIKERTGRDLILATLIGARDRRGARSARSSSSSGSSSLFALAAAVLGIFEFSRALIGAGRRVDLVPQLGRRRGPRAVAATSSTCGCTGWRSSSPSRWSSSGGWSRRWPRSDGRTYGDVLGDVLIAGFIQLYVAVPREHVRRAAAPGRRRVVGARVHHHRGRLRHRRVRGRPRVRPASDGAAHQPEEDLGGLRRRRRRGARRRRAPRACSCSVSTGGWASCSALVILGTATAGDLGESMIKRDLGIKDMSSWLPGPRRRPRPPRLDPPLVVAALALYYLFTPLVACMTTTETTPPAAVPRGPRPREGLREARRRRVPRARARTRSRTAASR